VSAGTHADIFAGHDARRGIAWMLLTMGLFVSMDALAKWLTQSYPVPQVIWARYAFHFLLLAAFLNLRLPGLLRSANLKLQVARSLLLVMTTTLFFFAISQVPLATASALMYVAPLIVTLLSIPLLKERVGPRRLTSVAVGFCGALVILRPGAEVFEPAALLPLAAACLYAMYQITTRMLSAVDRPLTTLLYTALVGAALSSLAVPVFWQAPDPLGWGVMVAVGGLGALSQFCLIKAFQAAPASTVAPFSYSSILWATLYGWLLFADFPDAFTLLGAGIIVGSGLYIWHREHRGTRAISAD
jgi:drug/metabolite transporter (DMT)-like permease